MAFNTEKYIQLQSEKILERATKFKKLYLEFGGKLFDEHHFSRCVPGFAPDTKIKMLTQIRGQVEVIISIFADDIESGKKRHDVGLSYENYVIQLVGMFKEVGLCVNSVVIARYRGQKAATLFHKKLENLGIRAYFYKEIDGYPTNMDVVLSDQGYGADPFIPTTKPIVVTTGPGANSGKMRVALCQIYHELKRGNKVGYAKYETLPVWNLPLKHPINLAYEASTVNINDVTMIDNYHFEHYGVVAVTYNRDNESFPLLRTMFRRMYGKDIYNSPTDMGVNMVGFCIDDMPVAEAASRSEVIRRYYETMCYYKQGVVGKEAVREVAYHDLAPRYVLEEGRCAFPGLVGALPFTAEDDPVDLVQTSVPDEVHQRAGAADFDVVGVGADCQHAVGRGVRPFEAHAEHYMDTASASPPWTRRPGSQTCHGAVPLSCSDSSHCLSLRVSMGAQNPS